MGATICILDTSSSLHCHGAELIDSSGCSLQETTLTKGSAGGVLGTGGPVG